MNSLYGSRHLLSRFEFWQNYWPFIRMVCQFRNLYKKITVQRIGPIYLLRFDLDAGRTISYGSEFLGYLYDEITDVIQPDVYALLVFILSQCCDVYFYHIVPIRIFSEFGRFSNCRGVFFQHFHNPSGMVQRICYLYATL